MCLQFFEERKFYASRVSKVKLVLKLLALDAATVRKHGTLTCLFFSPKDFFRENQTRDIYN